MRSELLRFNLLIAELALSEPRESGEIEPLGNGIIHFVDPVLVPSVN